MREKDHDLLLRKREKEFHALDIPKLHLCNELLYITFNKICK